MYSLSIKKFLYDIATVRGKATAGGDLRSCLYPRIYMATHPMIQTRVSVFGVCAYFSRYKHTLLILIYRII